MERRVEEQKWLFLFDNAEAFTVLLSKLEVVKEEFSLKDLFRPRQGMAKKKEYWGYYWAVHMRSNDLGVFENDQNPSGYIISKLTLH